MKIQPAKGRAKLVAAELFGESTVQIGNHKLLGRKKLEPMEVFWGLIASLCHMFRVVFVC